MEVGIWINLKSTVWPGKPIKWCWPTARHRDDDNDQNCDGGDNDDENHDVDDVDDVNDVDDVDDVEQTD